MQQERFGFYTATPLLYVALKTSTIAYDIACKSTIYSSCLHHHFRVVGGFLLCLFLFLKWKDKEAYL